ncbi:unnamed protein product [Soboliphyme baturini]|uniref:DEP domain-containing protein n=1 Tax=Soboliphyme baturini TaxID=241478 RepID=A0A183IFY0_9BILA|nr:unnamed protein product [Soboliphyme baturini]
MNTFRQPGGFEPFHATRVWNEIVRELKMRVPSVTNGQKYNNGRQKIFRGTDAVQTLSTYLSENRGVLGIKEVNESKVLKLCQILMNDRIIEPIRGGSTSSSSSSSQMRLDFDATDSALYRFGERCDHQTRPLFLSPASSGTPRLPNMLESQRKCITPNAYGETSKMYHSSLRSADGSDSFKGFEFPHSEGHVASCSSLSSVDSSSSVQHSCTVDTVDDLDAHVVHDVALFKLLTLIEVPVLDGILFTKDDANFGAVEHSWDHLFNKSYSKLISLSSKKKSSHKCCRDIPSSMFNFSDPWLHSAAFCLQELEISLLSEIDQKPTVIEQRLLMFQKVVDHFKRFTKDQAVVPERYDEIVRQIIEILVTKDADKVLTACKLLLLLLTADRRRRLASLLRFANYVVNDKENVLCDQMTNMDFMLTNFKDVVFRCRIVPAQRQLQLLKFLIVQCHEVLTCPPGFRTEVISRQTRSPSKELPFGNKSSKQALINL